MPDSSTKPASAEIQRWEEGVALSDTFSHYLNLSSSLKTAALQGGSRSLHLARRVEAALGTLYPKLDKRIGLLWGILSRIRNEVVNLPLLHRLPEEILSEIFTRVVFRNIWENQDRPIPMEDSLSEIQQRLRCLLCVCSVWRNILLARDVFWSTVGVYYLIPPTNWNRVYLPIRETRGANLHLVLALPLPTGFGCEALEEHASRFRTINISAEYDIKRPSIKDVIDVFLKNRPPLLSELSISHDRLGEYAYHNVTFYAETYRGGFELASYGIL
ncbi:unnamed protein product [Rhizoctonia solani]|uniref:F-box domain-containing protein n=1 Tax=Rhizoctonia solani TaxID=456999 RepID=A0A8H3H4V6_9AGAM|nr:unnamed protein product [Rhizoctonia solani]